MDIHTLDLSFAGHPHAIAAYLVCGPKGAALVETGPGSTLATLKARLADHGVTPPDIRDILITHIHLDHAGAAGWWARQGATVWAHHLGVPHLVDPARLLSSAARVYGEALHELWGDIAAAPASRVRAVRDGDTIEAAGLRFTALETPGHASHHVVYLLDGAAFTGDIAGIRLPESDWVELPTPPPDFDLALWLRALARLEAQRLRVLYPTHYGPIDSPGPHLAAVRALLVESATFVRDRLDAGLSRDQIVADFAAWQRRRAEAAAVLPSGLDRHEAVNPAAMCVDGILRYWRKKNEAAQAT